MNTARSRPDARQLPRARTRLRSGKITDEAEHFLAECRIVDRSATGARIRLLPSVLLPDRVLLFDDGARRLDVMTPVWRRDDVVGLRRGEPARGASARGVRRRLAAPFYAAR